MEILDFMGKRFIRSERGGTNFEHYHWYTIVLELGSEESSNNVGCGVFYRTRSSHDLNNFSAAAAKRKRLLGNLVGLTAAHDEKVSKLIRARRSQRSSSTHFKNSLLDLIPTSTSLPPSPPITEIQSCI